MLLFGVCPLLGCGSYLWGVTPPFFLTVFDNVLVKVVVTRLIWACWGLFVAQGSNPLGNNSALRAV